MISVIKVQFIEWLNRNYCILTCLFGCKNLLCFCVFYGCEQRVFQLLAVPNKHQMFRRFCHKSPSERTPRVQACSLLNTRCWREGDVFLIKKVLHLIPLFSIVSSGISSSPLPPKLWLIRSSSIQQWNCWSKRMISIHVLLCFCRRIYRVFVSAECLAENSFVLLNCS